MIRAFVGIPLPAEVARMLEAAQAGLPAGNAVPPENFHLTLAFLGEHQEPVIEDVHHELEAIRAEPVTVEIQGLGTFGDAAPRILHADVAPEAGLSALRKKVRRAARDGGIELEHEKFHPHITLARLGKRILPEDAEALRAFISRRIGRVSGQFEADQFCLYESRLGRNGPVYSVLAEYPLG